MLTTTVCAALSAAGLAIALLTAYRRRFLAATRIAAFSLLPVGLAMAGLIGLGGKIGRAVGGWSADLVLKPTVWAGFGVLAVAVVLYVATRFASGRGADRTEERTTRTSTRKERRAAAAAQRTAVAPSASAPSLGAGHTAARPEPKAKAAGGKEDFSDIEAILKKHGI
ncbi:hypothetical protein [Streptomyces sp. H27-D2]|uniref:hypothetical protein n=1 Tax=Streptomyces sp. H27-D2 TaxID=3046304 RepID=UPI002DBCA7CA|nr:hypothetical protein [Streptomyces sp. H27-D2]MEC4020969.1 hypothetical protein [Streptomyces sp. H27-D2]